MAEPVRSPAGYRSYPPEAVRRVWFIKRAQELGFTLAEVRTLLHLAQGSPEGCDAVRELATEKVADVGAADRRSAESQGRLTLLVATCERPGPDRDCPILLALEGAAAGMPTASRTKERS